MGVVAGLVAFVVLVDLTLNPRDVTDNNALRFGVAATAVLAVVTYLRGRDLDRNPRPVGRLPVVLDLGVVGLLSWVCLSVDGVPPLMFLFLAQVVSNTFVYRRRARVVINTLTLLGATITSAFIQPGIGNTILAIGFMVAVGFVAEVRMRDLELVDAQRQEALRAAERRTAITIAAAGLRTLDLDEVYGSLVSSVQSLGFDHGHVAAVADDGLRRFVASTDMPNLVDVPPVPGMSGLGGQVLATDATITVEDYHEYAGRLPHRLVDRGLIGVPIRCLGEPVAVLYGARRDPGPIDPIDVEVVEVLALHAGHAIENVRLYERERDVVRRLVEVDELRNDLLSNVSHELRTPLQAIAGMGETLAQRGHQIGGADRQLLLDRINANAQRLRDRIETLLTYSRFESGQTTPELAPLELHGFLRRLLDRLSPLLVERNLVLDIPDTITAMADARLLEHVIENLVMNALQHTPPGTSVLICVKTDGDVARVRVCDEGPGVGDDDVEQLTQRFFRGGEPTRRDRSGLGLGLSLVAAILEGHDTKLEVGNLPTGGACFAFELQMETSRVQSALV